MQGPWKLCVLFDGRPRTLRGCEIKPWPSARPWVAWELLGKVREASQVDFLVQLGAAGANDVFGTSDAVVKYVWPTHCCLVSVALAATAVLSCCQVLEGHDRGVNWASFHPTFRTQKTAGGPCFRGCSSLENSSYGGSTCLVPDTLTLLSSFLPAKHIGFMQFAADLKSAEI